jgi:putative tryptophan/tyrosine transport system substrate-binding protein
LRPIIVTKDQLDQLEVRDCSCSTDHAFLPSWLGRLLQHFAHCARHERRLREAGYVDGQNIILDTRYHHGSLERIDGFARELVAIKCSVIVAAAPYAIRAVLKETNTIPIVGIDLESDPVANGWVKSLARPGGNFTGLFLDIPELGGKQIELLKNVVPTLVRLAVLWDATIATLQFRATETAARSSGVTLESFPFRTTAEIIDAVERAAHEHVDGMIILTSPLIFDQRSEIADLALKGHLPTISAFTLYPKVGGLMAYGPSLTSMFTRTASYVDRILSGANPGELPIERPSKFELVINFKTAKTLGLRVPWQLQQLADEVIEQRKSLPQCGMSAYGT